jgi:uncharacterized protein related to proFAR isomerase
VSSSAPKWVSAIETPVSRTSDPLDVVRGLLSLAPFSIIYVADLDAIRRRADNIGCLRRLREAFPDLHFWIDSGASDVAAVDLTRFFGEAIVGSESQRDLALLASQSNALLSLDFRGDEFMGPSEILTCPNIWPDRVIVMTLMRVGAGIGPDIGRLRFVRGLAGSRQIFAAGGVRGVDDLAVLKESGADGVLVASALHDGGLLPKDLD